LPRGQIVCSDAEALLGRLKKNSADIVFLDPPFNLGKRYGSKNSSDDRRNEDEYRDFMRRILRLSVDVLKPGGALYLYHLPFWASQFASDLHRRLTFRHWIAIAMKNGFVRGKSLYPAHYALLYFTKGEPATFNRPKILPARCRHCDKYVKDYGGYREYVEDGLNLSDFWEDLSPVRHSKYKTRNANELPIDLPRRVVEISGSPEGIFVDPFAGSGATLVAAHQRGLRYLAGDYDQENCRLVVQRLADEARQELLARNVVLG
jgi:site-specific DNA-methyltransferase (adenine-specific)